MTLEPEERVLSSRAIHVAQRGLVRAAEAARAEAASLRLRAIRLEARAITYGAMAAGLESQASQ